MKEGEAIVDYFDWVMLVVKNMRNNGETLQDTQIVVKILRNFNSKIQLHSGFNWRIKGYQLFNCQWTSKFMNINSRTEWKKKNKFSRLPIKIGPRGRGQSMFRPRGRGQSMFRPWGRAQSMFRPWGRGQSIFGPWGRGEFMFAPRGRDQSMFYPRGSGQSMFGLEEESHSLSMAGYLMR